MVRLWPLELGGGLPGDPDGLRAWLFKTTSAEIDTRHRIASPVR
jgi:hypothetical protein